LVASDAGLGVIGRMGLLMTPRLGPRVRIAVVTTDLPLKYKTKTNDTSALRFCESCKKCAAVCPAKAIPTGPREDVEGSLRWKINSESCYNYWTLSGTDCGRCVISCPYSHPDNYFHRLIRWGIKNNLLFSRMAVKLDNVFYGRRP
jgi:epoxyqueuosine reductase QueG